jgi:transcriptional regulator with XRE-family HTH domain
MSYADSEQAAKVRAALGALLRHRREDAERSLAAVAEAAGISTAFLSELERGLKEVSTEKLVAVARALDLSPGDLYAGLARQLGARSASPQRTWPDDPKMQVRLATATLRPQALRAVADFSLYLASTQATPPRRRIGFTIGR